MRGGTGAMVIGDVGQNSFEEVDYQPASRGGRNYGWRNREGAHDNVTTLPPAYTPLIEPIHEYDHVPANRSLAVTSIAVRRSGRPFRADTFSRTSFRAASGRWR